MRPLSASIGALLVTLASSAAVVDAQNVSAPDNLVVEGVPTIPQKLVEDVDRYTEFRAAGLADWHPTKREMLIATRFADTVQVHHVRMPGGARKQLTFFKDGVGDASFERTGGDYFVFAKDTGGNEFDQYYRYDLKSGEVTLLTDGKSLNRNAIWSNKGDKLAYTSTKRNNKDPDFYVIDPKDPKSGKMIAEMDKPGWYISDWSPDDKRLLVGEYISANESYLWIMDVASGKKEILTPRVEGPEKIAYGSGQFGADGKGIYLTHDKGGEFQQLVYMDLDSKKETVLTAKIPWDVEGFDLSKDGKRLAFVTNEDGVSVLHLLDTSTHKEIPAPKLPAGQVSGLRWHDNNKDLGMVISSAKAPSDVYSVDMSSGEVHRWTESEAGGLNTANFVEPELIRWKSFDERTISGFLYKPDPQKHSGKRPVIINIHGGPESQFRPGFMGRQNYYTNELGVALIFPNVRGSSGYGKSFLKLDNAYQREDSVKDIGALLAWIAGPEGQKANLDAERIMVTGGSYGGYMSLAVSTHYADKIRCSIDVVGISNFVSFLERTEAYRRDLRRVEYGDERDPKMKDFLVSISPLTNAAKIKKPLLVIQGANDPRVPLFEAEQIVETVRKNNGTVWYLMAKDEGHGFAKKKNADFQFYVTTMFAREFLLK